MDFSDTIDSSPPVSQVSSVLIVDDELANIRYLEKVLQRLPGFELTSTTNASEARALFEQRRPDLVLLDLHMPNFDGIEVIEQLQQIIGSEDFIPIMVLTADVTRESREAALRAGAHDFLVKPLDANEVTLRVSNALRTRALHAKVQENRAVLAAQLRLLDEARRAEEQRVTQKTQQLREVIDRRAIDIVYQPIMRSSDGGVIGYESLSRFPVAPIRTPDKWFADANEFGLGAEFEMLAIEQALISLDHLPISQFLTVNISPQWLADTTFASFAKRHIADASRVVVEFTEHARVDDYASLITQMMALRDVGFRFAVDDAGSGFASLSHVLKLKPEWIKLDIEFTRGIDSDPARRAMASSLLSFAREVGAMVIAEGVETEAEWTTLCAVGIEYGQGYYLGMPGPLPIASR
jgi:EAL domain-containing protein (putative c-di-GMP-specific phosphodiesterase class I)/FixJ family two-component response regulator